MMLGIFLLRQRIGLMTTMKPANFRLYLPKKKFCLEFHDKLLILCAEYSLFFLFCFCRDGADLDLLSSSGAGGASTPLSRNSWTRTSLRKSPQK